ncbi:MAG: sigma-70 family RNA polymerase sigma factor [Bryobacteraceae bacterium]
MTPALRGHFPHPESLYRTYITASPSTPDTTQLLRAWADGDSDALEELTPRVYRELRRMAAHFLRNERSGHTLQTTDLVHEAYLRLVNVHEVDWQHRAHFFAVAASVMRRILVDRARRQSAAKRGARPALVDVDLSVDLLSVRAREVVALDDALNTLAGADPRRAQIVEFRFFGGLSVEETAQVLKVSPETVMRDWKVARAWLLTELSGQG